MNEQELFDDLCYASVQGDRLRVSLKIHSGTPLYERDQVIADAGVALPGEHVEALRRQALRIVRHQMPDRFEEFKSAVEGMLNEGTQKP